MTIEELKELKYNFEMQSNNGYADFIGKSECELAISLIDEKISQLSVTDLQQMKKEPCEYCELEPTEKIYAYGMVFKKIPINYCPNCSRKLR